MLAFAIRSVLAQDFADWELIVVGDRCSEATGVLVGSFADARIRYVNLALNYGEQSGPDNVGIARARGKYIAFLNHDDCWFPDHLRAAVDWLEATGADVVIARSATIIRPEGKDNDWYTFLTGEGRGGRYDPVDTNAPLSTVLLKSSVARAAGPLRAAADCYATTSQEWIYRIWKRGFDVRTLPHMTVVLFPSGDTPATPMSGPMHRSMQRSSRNSNVRWNCGSHCSTGCGHRCGGRSGGGSQSRLPSPVCAWPHISAGVRTN